MRNCDTCDYVFDCNLGEETLYCCENGYEHEVNPNDVCNLHRFIDEIDVDEILGYDCDGNIIKEFRILRFPFSADIESWDEEINIDPRFYCLVKSSDGEVLAVSVYDDISKEYIIKYKNLTDDDEIPVLVKTVSEISYYEVAFCGITGEEWYYDRNRF